MNSFALASMKLSELMVPKSTGEPVNAHVVESAREPQPDFDAMLRTISGDFSAEKHGKQD